MRAGLGLPLDRRSAPLDHRSPNVQFNVLNAMINKQNFMLLLALAIAPLAYGGVHICALSVGFPTKLEGLAWKVSCYFLIAVAGSIFATFAILYQTDMSSQSHSGSIEEKWVSIKEFSVWALVVLMLLVFVLHCAARMFLVIESFISLRHVPLGVYQMPDLDIMGNIPHL